MATDAGWYGSAACAGLPSEAFYRGAQHAQDAVTRVCRARRVRTDCLQEALRLEDPGTRYGLWEGLTARERDARIPVVAAPPWKRTATRCDCAAAEVSLLVASPDAPLTAPL